MNKSWSLLLVAVFLMAMAGCSSNGRTNWACPGPAAYQQQRAQRFDPYAEKEVGPEIVGARPREFDKPVAEPARARWLPWNWSQR